VGDGDADVRLEYVVRGSHRSLAAALANPLGPPSPPPGDGLVVVPLARKEPFLQVPATLAADLGWPLLLLCSHGNQARRVRRLVAGSCPKVEVTAADLVHRDLLRARGTWATETHPAALRRLDIDTHRKRNLGLAAARMTGRSWVLFVDDDIMRLGTDHVVQALRNVRATGRRVAGWPCEYYPDNSVVHHARRDFLGLHQDVFLGAGALLVQVADWDPPGFPPVYNEDWLFLYAPLAEGLAVVGPDIGQASYDPYAGPERARDEEFGDVLGEGLYHLLHEREPLATAAEADYWRSVHAKRTKLIQRIVAELRRRLGVSTLESEHVHLTRALAALDESRKELIRATPALLADFVRRWRHDEELWRAYLGTLPQRETLKEALVYLGLHEAWIVSS
jgi:glycosyltransferase involved in cell wall biosynthesis